MFLTLNVFAYSDADLDGVDDDMDQCPNTLMTDLVDMSGCSIKSLVSLHHYDIIMGGNFSQTDYNTNEKTDTFTTTAQVDYYYKDFSLQASSSYYNADSDRYNDNGMNDSIVAAYYQFRLDNSLLIHAGIGVILPTYDTDFNNNNTDYMASISVSYNVNNISLFGGYAHTKVNDDDVLTSDIIITYQDTNAYNVGMGYYVNSKLYASLSYNTVDSIYEEVDKIETASIYTYYGIDEHWFGMFSYAYGISDSASDNFFSLRLGYYF